MNQRRYVRTGPLSFCQEMLLHIEALQGYPPLVSRLVRIDGNFDASAFAAAAQATIAAHEPLRSVCLWRSGEPFSFVLEAEDVDSCCSFENPASLAVLRLADDRTVFAAGRAPQMRHHLFRIGRNLHLWQFGVHHVAADAVSLQHYAETFRRSYVGESLPLQLTTSIDYARSQHAWLGSHEAQMQFEWWMRQVDLITTTPLPVRAPASPSGFGRARQESRWPVSRRNLLAQRAREWRVPPVAVFLAAFAQTLAARRAASQVVVLTNVPGRSLSGASTTTGAFYNTVPLTIPTQAGDARAASAAAAEALFQALDRQEVPTSLLSLAASRRGASPLTSIIPFTFNLVDHPLAGFELPGCCLREINAATLEPVTWGSGKFAISAASGSMDWLVTVLPSALVVAVEYDAALCDADDVHAMIDEYKTDLSFFFGPEATENPGDPSLVADWASP